MENKYLHALFEVWTSDIARAHFSGILENAAYLNSSKIAKCPESGFACTQHVGKAAGMALKASVKGVEAFIMV